MLTHEMKRCNDEWWIMCLKKIQQGGTITWKDEGHTYIEKDGKYLSPTKNAYRDLKKGTTKEFHRNYMIKYSK